VKFQALPGFRDFDPEAMAVRRWVEAAWHEASRRAGFQEWDGPPLEPLELFTAKSGAEITEQLYAFTDKGGRAVTLRGEMTPTLARALAERAAALPKPIKWYCVPQFFRYERPQRGRLREFYQWNVDVIGAAEPGADAEAMAVALEALRILGLGAEDVVLRLSDRRLLRRMLRTLEIGPEEEQTAMGWIDKLERDPAASGRLRQALGEARAARILEWCERFPEDEAKETEPVLEACADLGIREWVVPDLHIVRGIAYYTGTVWEIFDRQGKLRSIAGGGRYDDLIASFGGPDLPALGFGMGDVVLTDILRDRGRVPPPPPRAELYVIPVGESMLGPARRVLRLLRDRGLRADAPYAPVRVGRALRAADQAGARRAVIVGPEEWSAGQVRVRDLSSGEERAVALDDLE
jgi:histidyl-tRNA synthetase